MGVDILLMNPPYAEASVSLDMQFIQAANEVSDQVVAIHPATKWVSNTKMGIENAESKHLKEVEIDDGNKIFDINTPWKWAGIYTYDNTKEYDKTVVEFDGKKVDISLSQEERAKFYNNINFPQDFVLLVETKEDLYNSLFQKYKTMVNDTSSWIYDENKIECGKRRYGIEKENQKELSRVKEYLKSGKYKYCLYKGSFNHEYDEVQEWKGEDPDKLFRGQICWLTNKENVKNNIKYWMECPIFDMWRRYKLGITKGANCCWYGLIPALNFDLPEKDFRKFVDSLNNFTEEEIKVLKENNIHNADKL